MSEQTTTVKIMPSIFGWLLCTFTAMVGYTIHGSLFWSIVDFIFAPIALIKWLICKEISISVIKETFSFFLQ